MDAVLAGLVLPNVQNHSLAALAGAARRQGYAVEIAPFGGFRDIDEVAALVARVRPRLFGLSMQTTETALASATLVDVLRRRGYAGVVVVGGHFATLNAEGLLREVSSIDAVVKFAGEAALVALLRAGMTQDLRAVPGLVARAPESPNGMLAGATPILGGVTRAFHPPVDQPVHLGFGAADLVSSRGCEAHCSYCCVAGASDLAADIGLRAQRRGVGAIAEEIAALYHERRVRVFNFMDDNLLPMQPDDAWDWAAALADRLRRLRVERIAFSLQLRADVCTPPVVSALAALGLVRAYVGIDGYSGRQLVALGRNAPADAGPEALALLGAAGVFSVCNALVIGPTFRFEEVQGEIAALARVRHAPVHLLPIDVRAGSRYFERVRARGLLEGGLLCWRYRFADARTALLAEALTGLPTRLEEYSVPVALYDLGYNLGIAGRLIPGADIDDARAIYRDVTARWNADQIRVLRAAAAVAADGTRADVRSFLDREAAGVRALDDGLRGLIDRAMLAVERAASRAHGARVQVHARGRLISAVTLSVAMAACDRPLAPTDGGVLPSDATIVVGDASAGDADAAPVCRDGLEPINYLPAEPSCGGEPGAVQAEVTFDAQGVPGRVRPLDGGMLSDEALDCLQRRLAGYCFPSFAGTTQTLVSHHYWIA
jgi:B12 binding protein/radical SAM family protein